MEQRFDSIPLSDTYFTPEGYLIDNPILTRVGIFEYHNPDGTIRRELRLPEEVFAAESLASYKGKPVILTHEAGLVDVDNVQQEHIGTILSEGIQDGDNVRAQIVIHDAESLDYGLRELSLGYTQTPDETPGVWNGQPYDAIQRNIQINHLALVEKARAGEQARLNIDGEEQGGNQMSKARKDGLTPEEIARLVEEYKQRQAQRMQNSNPTTDEGTNPEEQTTDEDEADPVKEVKDRRDRRDASGDCETMDEASGVIAQQDEDIQKLLDFIAQLQAKIDFDQASAEEEVKTDGEGENAEANADEGEHQEDPLNMDSIDAYVNQKIELIRLGDKLNMDGLDTMKPTEAKKAIIKKVHPNIRLDGKGSAYINAMFDIAKESIGKRKDVGYQRRQMFRGDSAQNKAVDGQNEARRRMIEKMDGGNK
ncbi:MAG: DUF2213 domain-containing protein [Negativibacillus sp.]